MDVAISLRVYQVELCLAVLGHGICLAFRRNMVRSFLTTLLPLTLLSLTACIGGEHEFPEEESCNPSQAAVEALELGAPEDSFDVLQTGDAMEMEYGLQGGMMFFFRMRATGAEASSCMNVQIELTGDDGTVFANEAVPVRFFEEGGEDGRISEYTPVVLFEVGFYDGKTATLRVSIGDAEDSRVVLLEEPSDD